MARFVWLIRRCRRLMAHQIAAALILTCMATVVGAVQLETYYGGNWVDGSQPLGPFGSPHAACAASLASRNSVAGGGPGNQCYLVGPTLCWGYCYKAPNDYRALVPYSTVSEVEDYFVSTVEPQTPHECDKTNPCDVVTGRKVQKANDIDIGLLSFSRFYDSDSAEPGVTIGVRWRHTFDSRMDNVIPLAEDGLQIRPLIALPTPTIRSANYPTRAAACGSGWDDIKTAFRGGSVSATFADFSAEGICKVMLSGDTVATLSVQSSTGWSSRSLTSGGSGLTNWGAIDSPVHTIVRPSGAFYTFEETSPGVFKEVSGYPVRLELDVDHWLFYDSDNVVERFQDGRLLSRTDTNGRAVTLAYDASGHLDTVIDDDGNTLQFSYNGNDQVESVTHADGQVQYAYDTSFNLISVTHEDASVRQYHYENTSYPSHLTGITDERGIRYATWAYDAEGRAVSSSHAGNVDLVTLDYYPAYTEVTDASGGVRQYQLGSAGARQVVTSVTGDKCIDCPRNGMKSRTYDVNGYLDEVTDWEGNITDYDYDAEGLEVQRIEGKGAAQSRTISTVWHSVFRVPTQITEPDRITNFTYSSTGALLSRQVLPNPGAP
jgi:YD repeat-containing protein